MSQSHLQDVYPLTATQQGLLFHSLYAPKSGVYVVQLAFDIKGDLNHDGFNTAWQTLCQRHDVLRTAFAWDNLEKPLQVVAKSVKLPCHHTNLQSIPASEQQAKIDEYLARDRNEGFKLSSGPLMRVACFQLARNHHRVICSYHHLLLDGWSLPILLGEWREIYLEYVNGNGKPANLAAPVPFKKYVVWQQKQNKADALNQWQQELSGITEATLLAPNTTSNEPCLKTVLKQLPTNRTKQLASTAAQQNTTLSTLIQGAWGILLGRYTGQNKVVFGLTRSGRPAALAETQRCVGLFITTLPMIASLDSSQTVQDYLQSLQNRRVAQQDIEHIGQAELRETYTEEQAKGLFDSIVVFENYPAQNLPQSETLQLANVQVSEQTHYPVSLFAVAGEQLELRLLIDSNRVNATLAQQMLDQLDRILELFCSNPMAKLGQLNLATEQEQIDLDRLNATEAPITDQPLAAQVLFQASVQPSFVAIEDSHGSTTYKQLAHQIVCVSQQLHELGFGPGDRIALCMERNANMVAALLGILNCGAAYVPLDSTYPTSRLQHMLEDSQAAAVIYDKTTQETLRFWPGLKIEPKFKLGVESNLAPECKEQNTLNGAEYNPNTLAYTIYTSGSTGLPKGVNIQQSALNNLLDAMQHRLKLKDDSRWLALTTLCFDISALEVFLPLREGACLILATAEQSRNAESLAELINHYDVNVMQATPSTWRLLQQAKWQGKANLQALSGGEALDQNLAQYLLNASDKLWNVYGPTETTIWSAALQLNEEMIASHIPVGGPLNNTQLFVLNRQQQIVPPEVEGELCIGGAGLSSGYLNREALTGEKFIQHPAFGRLYRTGDKVVMNPSGHFTYKGRFDNQIKLRGHRIELEEIEKQLRNHPAIHQAAVIVNNADDPVLAQLLAFVEPLDKTENTNNWRDHLLTRLPEYMIPSQCHYVSALPLTPNGKLDRNALHQEAARLSVNKPLTTAPETPLQQKILELWQSLLNNPSVGINDHFFEVGGHSLLVVRAQSELKKQVGVEVSMVDLFQHPTVATLARRIEHLASHQENTPERNHNASNTAQTTAKNARQRLAQRRQQQKTALNSSQVIEQS